MNTFFMFMLIIVIIFGLSEIVHLLRIIIDLLKQKEMEK